MGYPISEQLIARNRPHEPLSPQGFVIHANDDPGATAQNIRDYFNNGDRSASAHDTVDWQNIIRMIPENEVAWHAGYTSNHRFLSVEMCEPSGYDPAKFAEVWVRTIWLVADACVRYGWGIEEILSHADVSNIYHETDHQDPLAYFSKYGKTFKNFKIDVAIKISELKGHPTTPLPHTPTPTQQAPIHKKVDKPKLAFGAHGDQVIDLQNRLHAYGYYKGKIDGDFGPLTQTGVTNFQSSRGLVKDGVVGPLTWSNLLPVLREGAHGDDVKLLQRAIGVKDDGDFGPITRKSVEDYQESNSLGKDGVVGPLTWGKLLK